MAVFNFSIEQQPRKKITLKEKDGKEVDGLGTCSTLSVVTISNVTKETIVSNEANVTKRTKTVPTQTFPHPFYAKFNFIQRPQFIIYQFINGTFKKINM